ncbi:hypothetical protein RhiirA4_479965 [Rhizophagus irregularis]|uniref:Uncharacterized protein n=1 Tax=Rhizophagus irregularis TaxID=588596 RepID=A0A2I1HHD2_9GLOM|nr:hypothetical protein RhiirA4_479965 [Rhizophagus irregularis]
MWRIVEDLWGFPEPRRGDVGTAAAVKPEVGVRSHPLPARRHLDKSPLPSSMKNGKDYLNQINSPLIDFKEKVVTTYNEINFTLYYRPLFRAIQALLQRPEVANNFVHKGIQNKMKDDRGETRIFGEPFEDATTFDGLGKSSGHPVFLTLGNIPNRVQNLPEAKILLGFLPKVQDTHQ